VSVGGIWRRGPGGLKVTNRDARPRLSRLSVEGAPSEQDPVLVTGAAGFIGSHLVDHLLHLGHTVVGVDDFDPWYDPAAKHANLAGARFHPSFTFVEADLGALADRALADLLAGVSVVFHLAGRPGVQDSWGEGFGESVRRNVEVTQRIYEAALAAGVGRVVYASSSSVYGSSGASGRSQRAETAPISPYGVTKLAGEQLAEVYRSRGLATTTLRYFTVYGPRQRPDMAMHRLFRATTPDGPVFGLRGRGDQRREFTHVDDVVRATVAAGFRPQAADATIDIGGGSGVRLRDVIDLVTQIAGAPVRIHQGPPAPGDPATTRADHRVARRLLGWEPQVDLETGLRSQGSWHRRAQVTSGLGGSAPALGAVSAERAVLATPAFG
jgi:UDP-glucose 4-epimerase